MNQPRSVTPSLAALQAFEAAARLESFTRAAEELHLTQGAVSRQVAILEATLGLRLFERIRQRIVPTEAGRAYAAEIRDILSRLQTATLSTMAMKNVGGTLSLALLPTFGTRWLIPRLPDFFARHPEIAIDFSTRIVPFDFAREPFDAAIHFGDPTWPGTEAHRLMGEMIVPVASPAFLAREAIGRPEDLTRVPLLRQATRPQGWAEWFEAQGLDPETARPGPRFEQFAMVAQAAVAGLGVAVVPRFLIEDELKSGQLVIPFDRPVESRQSYWLVYPTAQGERPALRIFRDWLLQAVGR
ncbi:MAG: transcriptional regulator GcvA [Beijerinckiaceae bacterium]|nr:transcriptional regulator GcvA [Beijerinckiaceae bacterium]